MKRTTEPRLPCYHWYAVCVVVALTIALHFISKVMY